MAAKTTTAIHSTGRLRNQSLIADPRGVPSLRMLVDGTYHRKADDEVHSSLPSIGAEAP